MKSDSKVYVVQNQMKAGRPKFNLMPAMNFGEIVFLLPGDANASHPEATVDTLHKGLRNLRPQDYVLLLGNPVLIGMTVAIASHYGGGCINLLQWEGTRQRYVHVPCDLKTSS